MPKFLISTTAIFAFPYLFIISQQTVYAVAQEENPQSSAIVIISTGIITTKRGLPGPKLGSTGVCEIESGVLPKREPDVAITLWSLVILP
jgi:hypothetical protein